MIIRIPRTDCFYDTMIHQAGCDLGCLDCIFRELGCSGIQENFVNIRNTLARMTIIDLLGKNIQELIKLL